MNKDGYTGRLRHHRNDSIMSRKKHAAHRHSRPGAAPGSRARKQCQALGARLAAVGAELTAWDEAQEEAAELYRTSLVPLDELVRRRLRELVLLLDSMYPSATLDDGEREMLSGILADMASDLIDQIVDYDLDEAFYVDGEDDEDIVGDDPELAAIYERHRDGGIDLESQAASQSLDRMVEEEAEEAEAALALLAQAQARFEQLAAQQKANLVQLQQAEDELVTELETVLHGAQAMDEAVRREHLRRVEAAHAQGTLADLMAVGFALEQDGLIAHLSEKRVAGYKQVLKDALQLTEHELLVGKALTLAQLELQVPPEQVAALTPADLLDMMHITADCLRQELDQIEGDLARLRDPRELKAWLRVGDMHGTA